MFAHVAEFVSGLFPSNVSLGSDTVGAEEILVHPPPITRSYNESKQRTWQTRVETHVILLFKVQVRSTASRKLSLVTPRLEILPVTIGYTNQYTSQVAPVVKNPPVKGGD